MSVHRLWFHRRISRILDLGQASERDPASARVDHLCVIQGWAVNVPVNVPKSEQGAFGPPRSAASECPRTTMGMACTVVHSSWKATNGGRIASGFVRAIPLSPRVARRCGAGECVRCYTIIRSAGLRLDLPWLLFWRGPRLLLGLLRTGRLRSE